MNAAIPLSLILVMQSASAALLVGNIGSPSGAENYSMSSGPGFLVSSYFTTGATPWLVDELILPLATNTSGAVSVELTLWSDDGGEPGSVLGIFGSEIVSSEAYSNIAFSPNAPLVLDASTNYWVALRYLSGISGSASQVRWSFTLSSVAESGGEPGAAIPPTNNYASSEDGGATWEVPGWEPQIFRVTGVAVPEPSAFTLFAGGVACACLRRRRTC